MRYLGRGRRKIAIMNEHQKKKMHFVCFIFPRV